MRFLVSVPSTVGVVASYFLYSHRQQDTISSTHPASNINVLGNVFYNDGEFEEAVRCYSETIKLCPVGNRSELVKLLQNRAAAYDAMVIILNCDFLTICIFTNKTNLTLYVSREGTRKWLRIVRACSRSIAKTRKRWGDYLRLTRIWAGWKRP